jgi:transcriptional repressor NrdR
VVDGIERRIQEMGEKEVYSTVIGEQVMRELSKLDEVAYVRFASVYRSFKDLGEFMSELKELIQERKSHGPGPGPAPSAASAASPVHEDRPAKK